MKKLWLIAGLLIFLAGGVWGQIFVWTGDYGDGYWGSRDNWEDENGNAVGRYPGAESGDSVLIPALPPSPNITLELELYHDLAGLTMHSGSLTLGANLTVAGEVIISAGILDLGGYELSAATITNNGTITTDSGTLHSNGTVTSTEGNITGNTLNLRGSGTFILNNAFNDIDRLWTIGQTGAITYTDADGFAVGNLAGSTGISSTGAVVLTAGGAGTLTLTGTVSGEGAVSLTGNGITGSGNISSVDNTINLETTGGVVDIDGQVTASTLTLSGSGVFTLDNSTNNIATLETGVPPPAAITYVDTGGFAVGSTGISSSGAVSLTAGGDGLALTGAVSGGGDVSLTGNGITGSGNINSVGNTINLETTGGAVSIAGQVTASTLTLSGSGVFTLVNSTNNITTLETGVTPTAITYVDVGGFEVGIAGVSSDGVVSLTAGTGGLILNAGVLNMRGNSLYVDGNFTNNGTLTDVDNFTLDGNLNNVGSFTNVGILTLTGDDAAINANGATVTGLVVSKDTDRSATLTGNLTVNGNVILTAGILDGGGSNVTLYVHGDWIGGDGAFVGSAGTVVFDNAGDHNINPVGSIFFNLTKSGNGTLISSGVITATENVSISAGTLALGSHSLDAGEIHNNGTITLIGIGAQFVRPPNIGGTVVFTGEGTTLAGITSFYNLTIQGGTRSIPAPADGTLTVSGSFIQTETAGTLTFDSLTMTGPGSMKASGISGQVNINGETGLTGALVITSGVLNITGILNAGNHRINLTGTWNRAEAGVFNRGTGTVHFIDATVNNNNTFYNVESTGSVIFTGSNTFASLDVRGPSPTVRFAGNSTQHITQLTTMNSEYTATLTAIEPYETHWVLDTLTAERFSTSMDTRIRWCRSINFLDRQHGATASREDDDTTIRVFAGSIFTWVGAYGYDDWTNPANWDRGYFPPDEDLTEIIYIPNVVSPAVFPRLNRNVESARLTVAENAIIDLAGHMLSVTGNLTNDGTIRLHGIENQVEVANASPTGVGGTIYYYNDTVSSPVAAHWVFGYSYTNLVVADTVSMSPVTGTLVVGSLLNNGTGTINSKIVADSVEMTGFSNINADITTTGPNGQIYRGEVRLDGIGPRILNAGSYTVNLASIIGNNSALTIYANTATLHGGADIGALTINGGATFQNYLLNAASVRVTETSTINADITTVEYQDYGGPVTLNSAVNLTSESTVYFRSTVTSSTGNHALTITDADVLFGDTVGAVLSGVAPGSITVTAGSSTINADITTIGQQVYTGPVTLGGVLRTLRGSQVTLTGITGAARLVIQGDAVFNDDVDGIVDLVVTGTSAINANITTATTTGYGQDYQGAVTLGDATINLTSGAGSIVRFRSTVTSSAGNHALTITDADVLFNNIVGAVFPGVAPGSIAVTAGASTINADITTTGTQYYGGPVTLTAAVNFTSGNTVYFRSSVTSSAGNHALTITDADVLFNDVVGAVVPGVAPGSLAVTAGTSTINADITTSGAQRHGGPVTLGGIGTRTLSGAQVILEAPITGNNLPLAINAAGAPPLSLPQGAVTLSGGFGIEWLTVSADNDITIQPTALNVSGPLSLISSSGNVTVDADITVSSDGTSCHFSGTAAIRISAVRAVFNYGLVSPGTAGQVCLYLDEMPVFSGGSSNRVAGDRWHLHARGRDLVYSDAPPVGFPPDTFLWFDSGDPTIGSNPIFHVSDGFNIYIINVGTAVAHTRTPTFITAPFAPSGNNYIEFRGEYKSDGNIIFNPGIGGMHLIRLESAAINLSNYRFNTNNADLALEGGASSITAAGITLGGTVNGSFDLTLDGGAATISVAGPVGTTAPLGNIVVNSTNAAVGAVTFSGEITANSYTQTGTGSAAFLGSQNYLDTNNSGYAFQFTGSNLTVSAAITATAPNGAIRIDNANNVHFGADVSAASFTQAAGTGTTTFAAAQNYTGGFFFTGNDLTAGSTLTADGAILINDANDVQFNGNILAAGFTQAAGSGTTAFYGTQDYAGDFSFTGATLVVNSAVGPANPIGSIFVNSSAAAVFNGVIHAYSYTQIAGDALFTAAQNYHGVNSSGNAFEFSGGGAITINAPLQTDFAPNGQVAIDGDLTLASTITASGSFSQAAGRTVQIGNGSIITNTTPSASINFGSPLTLTGNVVFSSGAVNGDITLQEVDNSAAGNFTIQSGSGTVNLLGNVAVNGAFAQSGAGTVNVYGNIATGDGDISFDGAVSIQNTGRIITSGSGAGNVTFAAAGSLDGAGPNPLNLTITAGTGNITFDGTVGPLLNLVLGNGSESGMVNVHNYIYANLLIFGGGQHQRVAQNTNDARLGNVRINDGTTLTLTGYAVQRTGSTLTVGQGASGTLIITGHSWRVGGTSGDPYTFTVNDTGTLVLSGNSVLRANNFAVNSGSGLFFYGGSRLHTGDFLIASFDAAAPVAVEFRGAASVYVSGNVSIGDGVTFGSGFYTAGIHDELNIFTTIMSGGGAHQQMSIGAGATIGSLRLTGNGTHVTILTDIEIRGDVLIEPGTTLQAGLNPGDSRRIHVIGYFGPHPANPNAGPGARWFQTPYSYMNVNTDLVQVTGHGGTFIPNSSTVEFGVPTNTPVGRTFRIAGNTAWYVFACHEPLADILFSNYIPGHRHTVSSELALRPLREDLTLDDAQARMIKLSRLTNRGLIPVPDGGQPHIPPDQPHDHFWFLYLHSDARLSLHHVFVHYNFSSRRIPLPFGDMATLLIIAFPYHSLREPPIPTPAPVLGNPRTMPSFADSPDYFMYYSFFNVNWFILNEFFYSFTEDANRNGRIDRIRAQAAFDLNGDFSAFDAEVDGYTIDRSRGHNGFQRADEITGDPSDRCCIYIWLVEKPYSDAGATLTWRVTRNNSLKDFATGSILIGLPYPDHGDQRTFDTVPPRINYAFTLPGHPEIFFQMSRPVAPDLSTPSGNLTDLGRIAPSRFEREFLVTGINPFSLEELAAGNQFFQIDNVRDGAAFVPDIRSAPAGDLYRFLFPSPRYPVDWNYSGYVEITGWFEAPGSPDNVPFRTVPTDPTAMPPPLPPIRDWDFAAHNFRLGNLICGPAHGGIIYGSALHRVTDMLISIPPRRIDENRFFVWPLWARYEDRLDILDNDVLGWGNHNRPQAGFMGPGGSGFDDATIIWDFTGRRFLELYTIILQSRLNNNLPGLHINMVFDFDVADEFRADDTHGSPRLWLPDLPPHLVFPTPSSPFLHPPVGNFFGMVPRFQTASSQALTQVSPFLFNHRFDGTNTPQRNTSVEFFYQLTGTLASGAAVPSNLLVARLDITPGTDIPADWFRRVRPFSFGIHGITRQRSGVTILNNVINSDRRERVFLDFRLLRAGRVTIQVFTLDGTLVRVLEQGHRPASGNRYHRVSWDGTNAAGRPVARGMYFIRIVAPDIDEIRKVMVVR